MKIASHQASHRKMSLAAQSHLGLTAHFRTERSCFSGSSGVSFFRRRIRCEREILCANAGHLPRGADDVIAHPCEYLSNNRQKPLRHGLPIRLADYQRSFIIMPIFGRARLILFRWAALHYSTRQNKQLPLDTLNIARQSDEATY